MHEGSLYWIAREGIYRMPLPDGPVELIQAASALHFALGDTLLFWDEPRTMDAREIWARPLAGGHARKVADTKLPLSTLGAAADGPLYAVEHAVEPRWSDARRSRTWVAPEPCGDHADPTYRGIVSDGRDVVLWSSDAFFSAELAGSCAPVPLPPDHVPAAEPGGGGILLDGGWIYWVSEPCGCGRPPSHLWRTARQKPYRSELLLTRVRDQLALAAEGDSLYWIGSARYWPATASEEGRSGDIMERARKDGRGRETLVCLPPRSRNRDLVVAGRTLYWLQSTGPGEQDRLMGAAPEEPHPPGPSPSAQGTAK